MQPRRTCLSLLKSTRETVTRISEAFDLSEQAVVRAALKHAQQNLGDLEEHPARLAASRRTDLQVAKVPIGMYKVDDARLEALVGKLYTGRVRNTSGAVDAAVLLLDDAIKAGVYEPTAEGRKRVMLGRRRPVPGRRA